MGVSTAEPIRQGMILLASPATDDPIVVILIAMGISGGLMLICGGLGLAARIRRAREAREAEKKTQK